MIQRVLGIVVILAALGLPTTGESATGLPQHVMQAVTDGRPVWVFLSDKGPSEYTAKLSTENLLSARAVRRIALRAGDYPMEHDLPVYSEYSDALRRAGLSIRVESRLLNAVSGTATLTALEQIARLPFVESFSVVQSYREHLPDTMGAPPMRKPGAGGATRAFDYGGSLGQIELIQVDRAHDAGFDGEGVFLCFLDTGFDTAHPAFDSLRLVATRDFINGDEDVGDHDIGQMSHGTATLSTAAALHRGLMIGVAPRADYALAKTEITAQEIRIEEDYWIAGLEWADSLGCDLVSSSLGYIAWYTYDSINGHSALATRAADAAAARGLLTVNSAGNEGDKGWRYMIVPADGDSVLAVGAIDFDGFRASFSSRGPTFDGRTKPDVMAPGVGVFGANAGSATYSGKTGTSFSAPLVAGVCALMLQQDSSLTPWQIIERLRETSTMANDPDTLMGWGIVRAARAMSIPAVLSESGIRVFPNPTQDGIVTIITPDSIGTSEYHVFTVSGQNVYSERFEGSQGRWDGVNSDGIPVASGIYLIRVITPAREEILKVAILREN